MHRPLPSALVSAIVLLAAPVAAAHPGSKPSGPASVPITIVGGQGSATGARPTVDVRVGDSKPVPVLLDTGSTGLQIYAPAVNTNPGRGVTVSSQRDSITYSGGTRFTGVQARAVIRIGHQPTALSVPFGLVQQASCVPSKPNCGAAAGVFHPMLDGTYGVLGIGMTKNRQGLFSPILAMPGRLGHTWSLHLAGNAGVLMLGARIPSGPGVAATVQLRSEGTSGGHNAWADSSVSLCDAVGTIRACVPGLFDSGTFQMQLWGSPLDTAPTEPGTNRVLAGTPVSVSLPGAAPFWAFNAGVTKSKDTVTVKRGNAPPFINYGVQAFYAFTISYDERSGTVTLRSRKSSWRSNCSLGKSYPDRSPPGSTHSRVTDRQREASSRDAKVPRCSGSRSRHGQTR
jgi:hypothetical protein